MPSDDIARLYTYQALTNIIAAQMNQELDQHVLTLNLKAGRNADNTFTGANVFSQAVRSVSGPDDNHLVTRLDLETAVGTGTGSIRVVAGDPDVGTLTAGDVWFNSTTKVFMEYNGLVIQPWTKPQYRGNFGGATPRWTSTSSITLPAGMYVRDKTNIVDMLLGADLALSTAGVGAGLLDAGTVAANTWYYPYLIYNPTTAITSGLLSTVNEVATGAITLPTGYTLKRQIPLAVRTNASAQLLPFYVAGGWPGMPQIAYDVQSSAFAGQVGLTQVLAAGSSGTFADIALAAYVPPLSKLAELKMTTSGQTEFLFRPKGATHLGLGVGLAVSSGSLSSTPFAMRTDSTQTVQYKLNNGSGNVAVDVMGFTITEFIP